MCRATGAPLPRFSNDEVLNYMVAEALLIKVAQRDKEQAKKDEKASWKAAIHQPGYRQ